MLTALAALSALAALGVLAALAVPAAAEPDATPNRIAGADRTVTAARVAAAQGVVESDTVLLARADAFPDALAAAGLAGALRAPVLLTWADRVPEATWAALERAGARRVLLLGGGEAISEAVAAELAGTYEVERVGGRDRFDTAGAIARAVTSTQRGDEGGEGGGGGDSGTVFVVRGDEFADALAAGSPAYAGGHPILLTRRDALPAATAAVLDELAPERAIVLGGPAAVSERAAAELAGRGLAVTRVAGPDRTATAARLAEHAAAEFGYGLDTALLARGDDFADALAASALAGRSQAPIVLAQTPDRLGAPTAGWLATRCPAVRTLQVVGGPAAISTVVADDAHHARLDCRPLPHPLELTYELRVGPDVSIDPAGFAATVAGILDDASGWSPDRAIRFRRVAEGGDFRLHLAAAAAVTGAHPACRAGQGCRVGDDLWIDHERWGTPAPAYAGRGGDWQRWLVNHLVGHWLGLDHAGCPAAGAAAPVLLDQGRALGGCEPEPRPAPSERAWVARRHLAPVTAAFAGDVHGEGRVASHLAAGGNPLAAVAPLLSGADLSVVNLETAVGHRGRAAPGKTYTFQAPPALVDAMAAAGVDVVNLANNHALDYGVEALLETIDRARAAGLAVVGAGRDGTEAYAPAIVRQGRRAVAVIGLSRVLPPGWAAGPGRPGIASAYDTGAAVRAVEAAAARADLVVVAVHWGAEGSFCPVDHQRDLAARLVAAGADVVAGHHPHVLQGIERRGEALVAHSLGNFVWYHSRSPSDRTGVWTVTLDGRGAVGDRFAPAVIGSTGGPVPVDGPLARAIRAQVRQRSPGGGICSF